MKSSIRFLLVLAFVFMYPGSAFAQSKDYTIFYGEDTAVGNIASFQGDLYILRYEGLFRYDADLKSEVLLTDTVTSRWDSEGYTDDLLSDESGLYGYQMEQARLIQILNKDGDLKNDEIIKVESNTYPDALFLQDGVLGLLVTESDLQKLRLIPLSGEEETELPVKNIVKLAAYKSGYAIALEEIHNGAQMVHNLSALDLNSGELEKLTQIDVSVRAITYDKSLDRVCIAGSSEIYGWQTQSDISTLAYSLKGDITTITTFSPDMAAVIVDNSVVIREMNARTERRTLTLQQPNGRSENYKTFIETNPDITLLFGGDQSMTPEEEFIEDMTTRSSDIDIFLLTDINLLSSIYNKGFGINMAKDDTLNLLIDDMYTPFYRLFKRDGAVYAFPQSLFITMIGYDPQFFESFSFDVPTNYSEFLDLSRMWVEDYADQNDTIYFNPFANGIGLISILERYADECMGNNREIIYNNPELKEIIQKYLEVSSAYNAYNFTGSYDVYGLNVIDVPHIGIYNYMPLSVSSANRPVISGTDLDLAYFVVNPYSLHVQEALAFIRNSVNDWEAMMMAVMLRSAAGPVERSGYAAERDALESEIVALRTELQNVEVIDRPPLEEKIKLKEEMLVSCENSRWEVTQKEIDWYQSVVDSIVICDLNPISILQETQADLFSRLIGGSVDVDRFLGLLDERILAIKLEALQ